MDVVLRIIRIIIIDYKFNVIDICQKEIKILAMLCNLKKKKNVLNKSEKKKKKSTKINQQSPSYRA